MAILRFLVSIFVSFFILQLGHAQPGVQIEVKKPKKYENRKLGSEKTGEKKFTVTRKLYQNTVTHYNYYFNANNRLNDVVGSAKSGFKDDYSQLLPFYNYTLQQTAQSKQDLDSIIYKCTAGILLHDLRNSWIDNLYLLLAKAYFFRNDLDSAGLTLQYLNFSYAPKEEGGYYIPIGSNASNQSGEFSIATKEKNSLWTKVTSRPPSRNESFIWQIRNHIEKNELPEASGLIEILRHDPNFPPRLKTDLNEVMAYWFYKQQAYDSSAIYLSQALNEAATNQEKARWEYLIAQMYQLAGKNEEAVSYFDKSIGHATDPILDVYARLNSIRIAKSSNKDYVQENINALLKMAKREKYTSYRDIIYYAAARIELERSNVSEAENDLLKSVKFSQSNPPQRSASFLLLADVNYDNKRYPIAYSFYDSIDIAALSRPEDRDRVTLRKPPLRIIAGNTYAVAEQDSLQALAKMPPEQVDAIIKQQIRLLRKSYGLKEEDIPSSNPAIKEASSDLFSTNNNSSDFYFYNAAAKARGFSEFRARWGERPNVDNWRRKSAIDRQVQKIANVEDVVDKPVAASEQAPSNSYEGMLQNIPNTPEKLDESNKKIADALLSSGQTFINKLEEYPAAIAVFEELLRRFPNFAKRDEVLFNLVYADEKTGDLAKSGHYKNELISSAPQSKYAKLLSEPVKNTKSKGEDLATKKYEDIYNLFIEGKFTEAKNEKRTADSTYGKTYWTPQLLFIESIYYIKQKDDSTAIRVLTDLTNLYRGNPMAERAKTMIDVLKRRKEIEDYLTKLEVTRKEDQALQPTYTSTPVQPEVKPVVKASTVPGAKKDSVAVPPVVVKKNMNGASIRVNGKDSTAPEVTKPVGSPPAVTKRDSASVARKDTSITQPAIVKKDTSPTLDPVNPRKDSLPATPKKDPAVVKSIPVKKDSVATPALVVKNFRFTASDPHYVVVLLDKVDPVYASEARNAFNRFNQEKYYNQRIEVSGIKLNERYHLVLAGPFPDAHAAMNYLETVVPQVKSRILPWLNQEKYSFLPISTANLEILKGDPDLDSYKKLIQKAFPGKF